MCNYTTDNSLVDNDSPGKITPEVLDKILHDPFRDTQAVWGYFGWGF